MTPAEHAKRIKLGNEIQHFGALFCESRFYEDAFLADIQESASKIVGLLYSLIEGRSSIPGLGQARDKFLKFGAAISQARREYRDNPSSEVLLTLVAPGEEAAQAALLLIVEAPVIVEAPAE